MMPAWVFQVARDRASKNDAWRRCVHAGRRVGIPEHAWLRAHTDSQWQYMTAPYALVELRGKMVDWRRSHGRERS